VSRRPRYTLPYPRSTSTCTTARRHWSHSSDSSPICRSPLSTFSRPHYGSSVTSSVKPCYLSMSRCMPGIVRSLRGTQATFPQSCKTRPYPATLTALSETPVSGRAGRRETGVQASARGGAAGLSEWGCGGGDVRDVVRTSRIRVELIFTEHQRGSIGRDADQHADVQAWSTMCSPRS